MAGGETMQLLLSRYTIFRLVVLLAVTFAILGMDAGPNYYWALVLLGPLLMLGIYDIVQPSHAILRNYPIIGHIRFMLEAVRPELRQYLIEDERDPVPFSREHRDLVYRRAKNVHDAQPFGTVKDVGAPGYGWISHSIRPERHRNSDFRVTIGGPDCPSPIRPRCFNISGTSFGAVSANAIMAFNLGAKLGGFAHNTGEGSISPYHRRYGGDIIWQVAHRLFRLPHARWPVRPRRIRQTGVEPAGQDDRDQAEPGRQAGPWRRAAQGQDHRRDRRRPGASAAIRIAFRRPRTARSPRRSNSSAFVNRLRELSGGKPIGMKLWSATATSFSPWSRRCWRRGDARFHRRRRRRGRHRRGASRTRQPRRRAARRRTELRPQRPGRRRPARSDQAGRHRPTMISANNEFFTK